MRNYWVAVVAIESGLITKSYMILLSDDVEKYEQPTNPITAVKTSFLATSNCHGLPTNNQINVIEK